MRPAGTHRRGIAGLKKTIVRAARDQRGAVAIEFGLIAIPFFFTLMAIFQVGFNYFQLACLDRAAHAGARAIMTGIVQQNGLSSSQFANQFICPALLGPMSCSNVVVNVATVLKAPTGATGVGIPVSPLPTLSPSNYWTNYVNGAHNGLAMPSITQSANSFCPGMPGDMIVVQVMYPVPLFTKILNSASSAALWEMNSSTFINEPFPNGQTYAGC